MNGHRIKAEQLYARGYNCAQAVLAAFCDETGLDHDAALKLGLPFGGGMASSGGLCGAVNGMFMVLSLKYGFLEVDKNARIAHSKMLKAAKEEFLKQAEYLICSELLKFKGKAYCAQSVALAADIIDSM